MLVGSGLYLTIRQASALGELLIADARHEAITIRTAARAHIEESTRKTLGLVADRHGAKPRSDGLDSDSIPTWVSHVFVFDGTHLQRTTVHSDQPLAAGDGLDTLVELELARRLTGHVGILGNSFALQPVRYRGRPVVIGSVLFRDGDGGIAIAACRIDVNRLRRDYLDAQFTSSGKLRIVDKSLVDDAYWSEPILPEWSTLLVAPAPEFVAAHKRELRTQLGIYAAVAFMFLAALAAVVLKSIRLVRHELALSRAKSSFIAGVSHELKTPLALIRMFSEMLAEGRVPTEEKKREYYGIISRESDRLTHLIDNILDFSKIEAGRKEYDLRPVDVGQVVRSTYNAYRVDLDRQGFEHSLSIADGLPKIAADPDAIAQVLVNLLGNAVKYSRDEKRLDIQVTAETRRNKAGVLISFIDSGIGIKPEDRAHLFDGFFRADDERVRARRGAGLGLSLVKHIVDAHGGSIDVESRLVKGTTFRIFLPEFAPTEGQSG
jgi:signal transduction histidine kinase